MASKRVESFVFVICMDGATGGCGRKLAEPNNYICSDDVSFGAMLEI